MYYGLKQWQITPKNLKIIYSKTYSFGSPVFKDYKYIVISKMYISSFVRFLLFSTCNVRMSEGTFCRVEVHLTLLNMYQLWSSEKCQTIK